MSYTAKNLKRLKGLEPIQLNPAMYIGGTDLKGLHHLLLEILSNSVDEALSGYGREIIVRLYPDNSISVQDYGRGIPVDFNDEEQMYGIELLATNMNAGGKFDPEGNYKTSAGLHGLGLKCVTALSDFTYITVNRDGHKYQQNFAYGIKTTEQLDLGKTKDHTGTKIHFKPSSRWFRETNEFNDTLIAERLQEFSYLIKGVKFVFINDIKNKTLEFISDNGLFDMLNDATQEKEPVFTKPIYITGTAPAIYKDGSGTSTMSVEVIMHYLNVREEFVKPFANLAPTPQGGTALTGFRTALTRSINDTARAMGLVKDTSQNFSGKELSDGLYVILSIKHPSPTYQGQTKDALTNPDAQTGTSQIVYNYLMEYFEQNPKEFRLLMEYLMAQRKYKDQMRKYKEMLLQQGNKTTNNLKLAASGKLAGCTSSNYDECEIMLVEGSR